MPNSIAIHAVLCAALACACNSGPEVVAMQRQDDAPTSDASTFLNLPAVHDCVAGKYSGYFSTEVADSGLQLQLNGPIGFSLVQLPTGPERILSLADDSKLTGSSSTLAASFTATIQGGSQCSGGTFDTKIVDGLFSIDGGGTVNFAGTVHGDYYSDLHAFTGSWNVFLNQTTAHIGGTWEALLIR